MTTQTTKTVLDTVSIEFMEAKLLPVKTNSEARKRYAERIELFGLLEDYFGEQDAKIILAIILAIKHPSKWGWLLAEVKKYLEEIVLEEIV